MAKHIRERLTYANVASTLCLFLLLGGATYAGGRAVLRESVPVHSVGTKQLQRNAVTGPKVAAGSLRASDLGEPVNSARRSGLAANAAKLGGAPPSAFLPSGSVSGFSQGESCELFCAQTTNVTKVEGFSLDQDCNFYQSGNAASYTLSLTPPGPGYRVGYSYVHGDSTAKSGSFVGSGQIVSNGITASGSDDGTGTIVIEGWITISFHYSITGFGDHMECFTFGTTVDANA